MAVAHKLTAKKIAAFDEPGTYGDGGNLWVQVRPSGSKSYLFRFMLDGKPGSMGLGSCDLCTLAEAREKAAALRLSLSKGINPLETVRAERAAAKKPAKIAPAVMTFDRAAAAFIQSNKDGWKSTKHAKNGRLR